VEKIWLRVHQKAKLSEHKLLNKILSCV